MEKLEKLSGGQLERVYEEIMREAFPPEELKPLAAMLQMIAAGEYEALGLFDGGVLLGCICLWRDGNYILIDYLCVPAEKRNAGAGARLLKAALEHYPPGTVFVGEVEAPKNDPEKDAMIYRRLAFYERCGGRYIGYDTALFGVHYKTVVWSESEIDEAEVLRRHDGFYRRRLPPKRYAASVQIPLREGERVRETSQWNEN